MEVQCLARAGFFQGESIGYVKIPSPSRNVIRPFGPFSSKRFTPGLVSRWCGGDRAIVGVNNYRSESLNVSESVRGVFIWIGQRNSWRTEDQRLLILGGPSLAPKKRVG